MTTTALFRQQQDQRRLLSIWTTVVRERLEPLEVLCAYAIHKVIE